jgi:hypothetical protein
MKVTVDGEEREVLTAEEAATKATEAATKAIEDYKAEHPDQTEAVTKLNADLEKAKNDLAAAIDKGDTNQVTRLRNERDAAQKALTEGVATLTKDFDTFKKDLLGDAQEQLLSKLAGNDKTLREKILFEFNRYNPTDTSKAGIEDRMQKAFNLVNGGRPVPKFTDNISGAGARGDGYIPATQAELSDNAKAISKALGISEEQVKKGQEVLKKLK